MASMSPKAEKRKKMKTQSIFSPHVVGAKSRAIWNDRLHHHCSLTRITRSVFERTQDVLVPMLNAQLPKEVFALADLADSLSEKEG